MEQMKIFTLNGESFEVTDAKARENIEKLPTKEYVDSTFANAIVDRLSGETVTTDMVSPVKHNVECYIHSTNLIASREVQTNASGNSSYPLTIREGYYTPQAFNADGSTVGITPKITWIVSLMDGTSTTIKSFAEKTYVTADEARRTKSISFYFNHMQYKGAAQTVKFQLVSGEGLPNFVPHVSNLSSVVITRKAPDGSSLETFTPSEDSTVAGITSLYPAMTIETDTNGVTVEAAYHADTKKYIDKKLEPIRSAILSLGGNV